MRHLFHFAFSSFVFFAIFSNASARCSAGEVLISEGFENLDLNKLPPGYSIGSPQSVTIVAEPGHGNVLKVNNTKQGDFAGLNILLDLAKVKGHAIRIAANTKFPGNYTPIPGKDFARPKILIDFKDKDGKDQYPGGDNLKPNSAAWTVLQGIGNIPGDAQSVTVMLRVEEVIAEAYFDDLTVELDPDPKSPPPAAKLPENLPLTAKAPIKKLDDGLLFSPDIAAAIDKNRAKTAVTASTVMYVGSGLPIKELEGKKIDKWNIVINKELSGAAGAPRNLLVALPDALLQSKAEVAILFGDNGSAHKASTNEELDWEDVARLCYKMGVVPVLAVPAGGEKDSLHGAMVDAASAANCPAIDLKAPSFVPRRIVEMTNLLDKFVFARVPPDSPSPGTKKEGAPDE